MRLHHRRCKVSRSNLWQNMRTACPQVTTRQINNYKRSDRRVTKSRCLCAFETPEGQREVSRQLGPWSDEFRRAVDPVSLAFVGDAIWKLHQRSRVFCPPKHVRLYREQASSAEAAEIQAAAYDLLLQSSIVTPDDLQLLNWAKSVAKVTLRQRFYGNDDLQEVYKKATAVEALVGFLYLRQDGRLESILSSMDDVVNFTDTTPS